MPSQESKRSTAKNVAKSNDAKYAAVRYVNEGISKLGLSYKDQEALLNKLTPLVTQRMEAGRDKTAMRAKIQEVNIKKKAVKQAKKNIQGQTMPTAKKPTVKVTKKPTMPTKPKPAVGADKAARKKYGPSSHNNGYTN